LGPVVGLAIRDLKHDAGMSHLPSGVFQATAAWAVACTLARRRSCSAGPAAPT
jgi:hypothetical protein